MWSDLAAAVCLMLVLEGILPFLYPRRWRDVALSLAHVDDRTMRFVGLASMLVGTLLLSLVR